MTSSRPAAGLALFAAVACGSVGCEPAAEPDFTPPAAYAALMKEVRTGTRAEVEDPETGELAERDLPGFDELLAARFGSASDPAVFTALPVRFSENEAVVAAVTPGEPAEDGTYAAEVTFASPDGEELPPPAAGTPVHWTDYDGNPHTAPAGPAEGGAVTLAGLTDAAAPLEGERAVIGPPDLLLAGRELYVAQCAHCHGTTGAGDGPTAKYLYPKPRNYLPGVYKFTSTGSGTPSRADLTRILRDGLPGTYMPAFSPYALDEEQMAAVIEYVRWLSMRGRYVSGLASEAGFTLPKETDFEAPEEGAETREEVLERLTGDWAFEVTDFLAGVTPVIVGQWADVEEAPPVTPSEPYGGSDADSVLRGRDLYLQSRTQCVSCHGPRGLGNGPQTVSQQTDEATGEPYPLPGLHDAWGDPIRPRNLTRGIYRGGRRPIDLYRRLHDGITGSKMPGFGQSLSDAELWDLVNFVLALPHDPSLLEGAVPEAAPHVAP